MDSSSRKSSNKIRDIVRLQQVLKKWKKVANNNDDNNNNNNNGVSGNRGIKFLKKTLSFSELSTLAVPKGYVAVCVGKELKRFVIPTEYLSHQAFGILLRQAEEEFGFQQEGVLKFPCEVHLFENILKLMGDKRFGSQKVLVNTCGKEYSTDNGGDLNTVQGQYPQMCR